MSLLDNAKGSVLVLATVLAATLAAAGGEKKVDLSKAMMLDKPNEVLRAPIARPAARQASAVPLAKELSRPFLPSGADVSTWSSVYRQVDELDRRADEGWLAAKTREAYDARRREMHAKMLEAIGPFPARTPLNAKTVATLPRDGYRIEKVYFESMPGVFVTANLFLPAAASSERPVPGVVISCGHAMPDGKDHDIYLRAAVTLAKKGLAAFIFDPYEQGERRRRGSLRSSHNQIGGKAMLLGRSMAMLRIWDGMRAVDYAAARPEIDADRIGYMGQSGGGTMTALMTAADWRLKATAPSCYLTSFRYLCRFSGPQDAEQNIFGQLAFGLNHTSLVLLPDTKVAVTGRFDDMFPWGGVADLYRVVETVADRLGEKENYALNFAPGPHGWTESTETASADWMLAWLAGRKDLLPLDMPKYRALDLGFDVAKVDVGLAAGERGVTPNYCTFDLPGARDILVVMRDFLATVAPRRPALSAAERAALVKRLAVIRDPSETGLVAKEVGAVDVDGGRLVRVAFMYPDGLALPAVYLEPARRDPAKRPLILVGAAGRGALATEAATALAEGRPALVADLTGCGDIGEPHRSFGKAMLFSGATDVKEEGIAAMLYLMGESMVGRRATDLLALADWLARRAGATPKVFASGSVAVAAAHARAADPARIAEVEVVDAPPSWTDTVNDLASRPLHTTSVNGALLHYDWSDLLK